MIVIAILAFGTVVGGLARLLLPGRQHLGLAATTLAGTLGAATAGSLTATVTAEGVLAWNAPSLIGSVAGAAAFVLIADWSQRRLRRIRTAAVGPAQIVARGESATVEFKSSARHNLHAAQRDPAIELAIARTVAGFANSSGGTLVIGVADDGSTLGIDADLQHVRGGDADRFELWLHDLLETTLGRATLRLVSIDIVPLDGHEICLVAVGASDEPVTLRPHSGERRPQFHVRTGNSTRELDLDDTLSYVAAHWPRRRRDMLRARARWLRRTPP